MLGDSVFDSFFILIMGKELKKIFLNIVNEFNKISFSIGDNKIYLSSIFQVIIYSIIIIILTHYFNRFLKNKLLTKIRIKKEIKEAVSNIISYSLGTLLFIIILQTVGFNLSSLTVIGGALGIGIGFGLQNITKNFVSGLTLVIERNIKVGDFVEFDGLSGYVKEISTRSTIIQTQDGGHFIVPNSELVENRLLNWSYDGFIGRLHVPVGIAYGSDLVLVTEILLKSAYIDKNVLPDPPPQVIFLGFGESCLNFELRVWVNQIDKQLDLRSNLNFIIEYNLRQHKIRVPFPQRDLWLRNPEELNASLTKINNQQDTNEVTLSSITEVSEIFVENLNSRQTPPQSQLSIRDLLQEVVYFSNFNELELRQLIEIGHRQYLRISEVLFRENDPGDTFYIILSGSVEVFIESLDKSLKILVPGDFFGEFALMLGVPRTASIRALENTVLFSINKTNFEQLLHENPDLCEVIIQELGNHQEELAQRRQELRNKGLLSDTEDDTNLLVWVRNRLKKIFSL